VSALPPFVAGARFFSAGLMLNEPKLLSALSVFRIFDSVDALSAMPMGAVSGWCEQAVAFRLLPRWAACFYAPGWQPPNDQPIPQPCDNRNTAQLASGS